jgi:hypothetical protein
LNLQDKQEKKVLWLEAKKDQNHSTEDDHHILFSTLPMLKSTSKLHIYNFKSIFTPSQNCTDVIQMKSKFHLPLKVTQCPTEDKSYVSSHKGRQKYRQTKSKKSLSLEREEKSET